MELPTDPVELATKYAEESANGGMGFDATVQEEHQLAGLDYAATELGFISCTYFVESYRALSLPVSFEANEPVKLLDFMGLTFEGDFMTYSKVAIGRLIGAHTIRAVCLAFDNVTLLPYFDGIPADHLLFVPVLAVGSIDLQAAV